MAKLGNISILNESFDSGAAFLTQKPSPITSIVHIDSNSIVEVKKDNRYVVVHINGLNNYQAAYDSGHELVQKGLDILSIAGRSDLCTRDVTDEHFVWWRSNDKITLRITDTSHLGMSGSMETESVYEDIQSYSKAYRYFRLSQATNSLFEAYRHMYLAFELLASEAVSRIKTITKAGKIKWESESEWLKRYLKSVNQEFLTSTFVYSSDPIQAFLDQIYKKARCNLFHAKDGESFFTPYGEIKDRQEVEDALRKLTRIFLLLAKEKNNLVRGLGMSMSPVRSLFERHVDNTWFVLSDDDSPFDWNEEGFDNPRYKNVIKSEKVAETTSSTHDFSLLGKVGSAEFKNLSHICRIELVDENKSLITGVLGEPLFLDGIDFLEIQLNHQVIYTNSAKKKFIT